MGTQPLWTGGDIIRQWFCKQFAIFRKLALIITGIDTVTIGTYRYVGVRPPGPGIGNTGTEPAGGGRAARGSRPFIKLEGKSSHIHPCPVPYSTTARAAAQSSPLLPIFGELCELALPLIHAPE